MNVSLSGCGAGDLSSDGLPSSTEAYSDGSDTRASAISSIARIPLSVRAITADTPRDRSTSGWAPPTPQKSPRVTSEPHHPFAGQAAQDGLRQMLLRNASRYQSSAWGTSTSLPPRHAVRDRVALPRGVFPPEIDRLDARGEASSHMGPPALPKERRRGAVADDVDGKEPGPCDAARLEVSRKACHLAI